VSPSEIAFLAIGLILGAGVGAAVVEALRARPKPARQVRITVSPNSIGGRGGHTLSEAMPPTTPGPVAGSPADPGSADDSDAPAGDPVPSMPDMAVPGAPGRTPVPSTPAGIPAGAVAVPVEGASSIPVGPGAMTMVRQETGPDDPEPRVEASATRRPTSVAVLDGAAVVQPPPRGRATVSAIDVGSTAPGVAVRPRPPTADPAPALTAAPLPVPVARPSARLPRRAADDELGGPMAITPAAADPCDVPRRLVDERCTVASEARVNAKAAADALRDAQRAYDTLRGHLDRAEQGADPREVAAAKDELHRRFRDASDGATSAEAAEAAAREWLDAINELNTRSREAARFLETGGADLRAAGPRIERLAVEADAARISAEGAEVGCRDARERLAECDEAQARGPEPVPPTGADEPHPFDEAWPGESESTRTQPLDDSEPVLGGPGLPLVIRMLRGDREARDRLVAMLGGSDPEAARAWQLRLTALVDAIAARAIEDGYLDLPDDHPFWGLFTYAERREVVGALSALGYRFDGLGGFADDRVPAARDLALAVGYAGLDRMRIRSWPRESESRELYARASVAADDWLAHQADDLSLGRMIDALGARAADLAEIWNAWGRVRPALLSED
jgi:hypothetical protein